MSSAAKVVDGGTPSQQVNLKKVMQEGLHQRIVKVRVEALASTFFVDVYNIHSSVVKHLSLQTKKGVNALRKRAKWPKKKMAGD